MIGAGVRSARSRSSASHIGLLSSVAGSVALTRVAALGTLSRAPEEGGPSPQGWVGEGVGRAVSIVKEYAESLMSARSSTHASSSIAACPS